MEIKIINPGREYEYLGKRFFINREVERKHPKRYIFNGNYYQTRNKLLKAIEQEAEAR